MTPEAHIELKCHGSVQSEKVSPQNLPVNINNKKSKGKRQGEKGIKTVRPVEGGGESIHIEMRKCS